MSEETQDVQAEETAMDSSTETNQSVDDSTDSEVDNTQESQSGDEGEQTVPYSRFQEVVKDRNRMKEMIGNLGQSQPQVEANQQQQQEGQMSEAQAAAREQLKGLFREAYDDLTRPQRQEQEAREKYQDYDQVKPFVDQILSERPDLRELANPNETAYMLAKGLMAEYGSEQAKEAGKAEAYKTINQKVAGRTDRPVPAKTGDGKSDLLKRFQSGQMSAEETRANWLKIQQEMAQQ